MSTINKAAYWNLDGFSSLKLHKGWLIYFELYCSSLLIHTQFEVVAWVHFSCNIIPQGDLVDWLTNFTSKYLRVEPMTPFSFLEMKWRDSEEAWTSLKMWMLFQKILHIFFFLSFRFENWELSFDEFFIPYPCFCWIHWRKLTVLPGTPPKSTPLHFMVCFICQK